MRASRAGVRAIALGLGLVWTLGSALDARAAELEVPALRSAVTDRAGMLAAPTRRQLENALRHLRSAGGTQLAVLTLPDLAGLSIEQASIRVAEAWKLGSENADEGVLLLVAQKERRVRIEVGQGLEGSLTDAYSKRIIDEGITPLFKLGDMDGGVVVGVYQIARITNPEVDLTPYLEGTQRSGRGRSELNGWQALFVILLMLFILASRLGVLPFLFMGGMGRSRHYGGTGSFGGGMRGGGFGGFSGGGGGFSGGGASGGW